MKTYLFLALLYLLLSPLMISCGKEDDAEIQVSQAEPGTQGEAGEAGEDGIDGVTTVEVEEVEIPGQVNLWEDPVTGLVWLIGSDSQWSEAQVACSGNFRTGSPSEVMTAVLHGVLVVSASLGGPDSVWTNEEATTTTAKLVRLAMSQAISDTQTKTNANGSFCVKVQ